MDVVDAAGRLNPGAGAWLRERAAAGMGVLGVGGEVRVRVVGDEEMAAAHERYAGVAGTTDVLTFDLSEPGDRGEGRSVDADILVCSDEAARQAARRGHAVERELLLYVIHGLLHCLGHDDHERDAALRMHAEEDRVLEAVGVGATYARGEGNPAVERGVTGEGGL